MALVNAAVVAPFGRPKLIVQSGLPDVEMPSNDSLAL